MEVPLNAILCKDIRCSNPEHISFLFPPYHEICTSLKTAVRRCFIDGTAYEKYAKQYDVKFNPDKSNILISRAQTDEGCYI